MKKETQQVRQVIVLVFIFIAVCFGLAVAFLAGIFTANSQYMGNYTSVSSSNS